MMNLLKVKEEHRTNHNIYIVQSNDIVKLGYTSNLQARMHAYYSHNPNTIFVGSMYREDGLEFEARLHKSIQSVIMNEWYPADMLPKLIEYALGACELPEPIKPLTGVDKLLTGLKAHYKDLCMDFINNVNRDDIAALEPEIAMMFYNYGEAKMLALECRKREFKKFLLIEDHFKSITTKVIGLLGFRVGMFYSSADIKDKLKSAYAATGYMMPAKASTIVDLYNAKLTSKRVKGIPTKGYVIQSLKY